jgi:hypothetical protein
MNTKRITAAIAAVPVMTALGGVAVAKTSTHRTAKPGTEVTTPDTDHLQQGDQTTPDSGAENGTEDPATEPASEPGGEQSGEGRTSDGPGGHEDPAGNVDRRVRPAPRASLGPVGLPGCAACGHYPRHRRGGSRHAPQHANVGPHRAARSLTRFAPEPGAAPVTYSRGTAATEGTGCTEDASHRSRARIASMRRPSAVAAPRTLRSDSRRRWNASSAPASRGATR